MASIRAKKSGKNARPVREVAAPQLFSLTEAMPADTEKPKKTEVELFSPSPSGPTASRTHISAAYTTPPDASAFRPRPLPREETPPEEDRYRRRRTRRFSWEDELPQEAPPALQRMRAEAQRAQEEDEDAPVPRRRHRAAEEAGTPRGNHRVTEETGAPHRRYRIEEDADTPVPRDKKRRAHTAAHAGKKKKRRQAAGKREIRHVPEKPTDLTDVYAYVNGSKTIELPDVAGQTPRLDAPAPPEKPYVPVKMGTGKTRPATLAEEREKRRKQEERLTYLIVGCVILFLIASGFLLKILWNYRRTADEYAKLTDSYVVRASAAASLATEETEEAAYPPLDINFPGLFALNNDLIGWVTVPACGISYPLVRTTDNDYYLNHTFLKNISSCGAIFMDFGDRADFSDFNSFIYGHNMQDGSMFGALHRFWQDEALLDSDPYFYIYLSNGSVRKYRIFSCYRDSGDSPSYLRVTSEEEKEAYIEMIVSKSQINPARSPESAAVTVSATDSFATLSTCHGAIGGGQRFLVHGVLVGVY